MREGFGWPQQCMRRQQHARRAVANCNAPWSMNACCSGWSRHRGQGSMVTICRRRATGVVHERTAFRLTSTAGSARASPQPHLPRDPAPRRARAASRPSTSAGGPAIEAARIVVSSWAQPAFAQMREEWELAHVLPPLIDRLAGRTPPNRCQVGHQLRHRPIAQSSRDLRQDPLLQTWPAPSTMRAQVPGETVFTGCFSSRTPAPATS
jgi:hypothetical protein